MVDGIDNKTTLFFYVDIIFLSFLAIYKIAFGFRTPCIYERPRSKKIRYQKSIRVGLKLDPIPM